MPKYRVLVSKEAGIYTQDFTVETENEEMAESLAEKMAKKTVDGWDYTDMDYGESWIQAEEVNEIESD